MKETLLELIWLNKDSLFTFQVFRTDEKASVNIQNGTSRQPRCLGTRWFPVCSIYLGELSVDWFVSLIYYIWGSFFFFCGSNHIFLYIYLWLLYFLLCKIKNLKNRTTNKYMLFTGQEVCLGNNCTQDQGHIFSMYTNLDQ